MQPSLSRRVRDSRLALGMTQFRLAHEAGVSLPSIQNIESGRCRNPSLRTIQQIFSVLGLEVVFQPREVDWSTLAACGAPISVSTHPSTRPSAALLLKSLQSACSHLSQDGQDCPMSSREGLAVQALLLAIRLHFPTFYSEHCLPVPLLSRFCPDDPSGPAIKLKRIALATLATYL